MTSAPSILMVAQEELFPFPSHVKCVKQVNSALAHFAHLPWNQSGERTDRVHSLWMHSHSCMCAVLPLFSLFLIHVCLFKYLKVELQNWSDCKHSTRWGRLLYKTGVYSNIWSQGLAASVGKECQTIVPQIHHYPLLARHGPTMKTKGFSLYLVIFI